MNRVIIILIALLLVACEEQQPTDYSTQLTSIKQDIDNGHFSRATQALNTLLTQQGLTADQTKNASFELERMKRIEKDFSASFDDVSAYIKRYATGVTDQQIKTWDQAGELEFRVIDNQRRYFKSAGYNLFQLNDDALRLRKDYQRFTARAPLYDTNRHHVAVIDQSLATGNTAVLPQTFRIKYSLTVDANAVPAGEKVKAWLPFPREIANRQTNITLIASSHDEPIIAPNDNLQRTVYMEATAIANKETEFWIEYQYQTNAINHNIDANKVTALTEIPESLKPFVAQRSPHVVFTPELVTLNQSIVGDETNPYKIAQKLFAYVDQIKWGTALEYSTIRNLSMRAFTAPYADCGQQTLLLITLLRMNGIPAKWQSGWEFSNNQFDTMHDWGMVYFEPYGWVPMDVTHGQLSSTDKRLTWFYLGGIDSYRLIFNDDYSQPFYPKKQHVRSETVDSQRGEVEWSGGNLYFDQWHYDMQWQVVKEQQPAFSLDQIDAQQAVLVITDDESAIQGQLSRFEKKDGQWQQVAEPHAIVVGRTGLAWGIGLHPQQPGKQKQEGDGKAPAGIFELTGAFGYLDNLSTQLEYSPMNENNFCIDVRGSQYYNQTVDAAIVGNDAIQGSSEPMRRDIHSNDHLYKKGIFVAHNPRNISDQGSCIFLHLWRDNNKPTAGCTAMSEQDIDELLAWLDEKQSPIIIALTKQDYQLFKTKWKLP
ncbi:transglutaminase domain-containing protein [Thalassotalea sp. G2M2-11]|uniref:transglutaminase domain-containing protein n=1 Tax=Thalassotalea sp. G2M2-11 TaxID=2787627 RepID=UPI0019CF7D04|nr:transglutaminase domain-containing protein [Thalassotalea sp. G2M2-11]